MKGLEKKFQISKNQFLSKLLNHLFFGSEIDSEILIMAKSHLDKWSDDDDGRFWLLIVFRLVIKSC